MRIRLLPSIVGRAGWEMNLTTFLVDGSLAIDAGSLGLSDQQQGVRDVVLTHSHIDHLATLPIFLDNTWQPGDEPVRVWGSGPVLESLRDDVFNDRIWPNFPEIRVDGTPIVVLQPLEADRATQIGPVSVTPIAVDHVVPTHGMFLDDGRSVVAIMSDTGPTERFWQVANAERRLKAVFCESSFPNEMGELARASGHLTPELLGTELAKLGREDIAIQVVHIKTTQRDRIVEQLRALGRATLSVTEPGRDYDF